MVVVGGKLGPVLILYLKFAAKEGARIESDSAVVDRFLRYFQKSGIDTIAYLDSF